MVKAKGLIITTVVGLLGGILACSSAAPAAAPVAPTAAPQPTPAQVAPTMEPVPTQAAAQTEPMTAPEPVMATLSVGTDVGNRIPDFEISLVDGSTVTAESLLNAEKPTFLFFMASW